MSDTPSVEIPDSIVKFHREYSAAVARHYPKTEASVGVAARILPTLISPHVLELPKHLANEASEIVRAYFELRSSESWQASVRGQQPPVAEPGNTSVLMSYDFHIDEAGKLRLIEINTNASLSLMTDELYKFREIPNVFSEDFQTEILASFEREFVDAATGSPGKHIGIVDDKPREQRLFVEFALYQELFERKGWTSDFYDPMDLSCDTRLRAGSQVVDFVYNRHTDFYFSHPETAALRRAMETNAAVISPHPWEYRLLADKDRLLEISRDPSAFAPAIQSSLIRTAEVSSMDPDFVWKDRKRWFFKPRRSHGGKAVYRGSSTARKTFDAILAGDYLMQEMVPPPTVLFKGEEELKYDLRFYVYRDKIQHACARLYRGQMTNSQSPGGGIAPIRWV